MEWAAHEALFNISFLITIPRPKLEVRKNLKQQAERHGSSIEIRRIERKFLATLHHTKSEAGHHEASVSVTNRAQLKLPLLAHAPSF